MNRPNNPRMLEEVVGLDAWPLNVDPGQSQADIHATLNFTQGQFFDDHISFKVRIIKADFKKASFRGTTFFQNTRFRGETQIQTKNPNNTKSSQGTSFHLFASFREASLSGYAALRKSSNARNTPSFPKARFKRDADFRGATFTQTIPQSLTPYL